MQSNSRTELNIYKHGNALKKNNFINFIERDPKSLLQNCFRITSDSKQLLQNITGKIGIVTVLWIDSWTRQYCHKMLLKSQDSSLIKSTCDNQLIHIYTKVQIGQTQLKQTLSWVYLQLNIQKINNFKPLIQLAMWISSYLFIDSNIMKKQNLAEEVIGTCNRYKNHKSFLNKLVTLSNSLTNQFSNQINKVLQQNHLNLNIGLESESKSKYDSQNTQIKPLIFQHIIKTSKIFTHQMKYKLVNNFPIVSNILLLFVQKILNANQDTKIEYLWGECFQLESQKIIKEALQIYQNKISQITTERSPLSDEMLDQAQKRARQSAINHYSRKGLLLQQSLDLLEQNIKKLQKLKKEQNQKAALQWGKQLLKKQFDVIQRKIQKKQIKSILSLKQQIILFKQFFKKKSQSYKSYILSQFFQNFMLEKIFDAFLVVIASQTQKLNRQISQQKQKINSAFQESSLIKKKSVRQQNSLLVKFQTLEKQYSNLRLREQELVQKNSLLQNKFQILQNKYELLMEQNNSYQSELLKKLRSESQALKDKLQIINRDNILLKSQIEKQKLLHQQTLANYQQIVNQHLFKQQQLSSRISIISIQSKQDKNDFKQSIITQNQDNIKKGQNWQIQIKELKKQLKNKNQYILEMQNLIKKKKLQNQIKIQELIRSRNDLQMQCKVLQQKLIENQSKMPRYRKMEEQLAKIQKAKDEAIANRQKNQKDIALLSQKTIFLQDCLKSQKSKNLYLSQQNFGLKNTNDSFYEKINEQKINGVDEWVQVQQFSYKSKLAQALKIVDKLQKQYAKIKIQVNRKGHHQ